MPTNDKFVAVNKSTKLFVIIKSGCDYWQTVYYFLVNGHIQGMDIKTKYCVVLCGLP